MKKILLTLAVAIGVYSIAQAKMKREGEQRMETSKTLVAYFSATGTTAKAARIIAEVTGGKLYAITPQEAYTSDDLNWNDKQSRSSVEMGDPKARPALKETISDIARYDVVFIGYPIWWDQAPRVINTFIESHDLKGKTLIPFATSGGSGIDNSVKTLRKSYPTLNWGKGKLLNRMGKSDIQKWINGLR